MGMVALVQVFQPMNEADAAKKRFDPPLAQVAGQDRGERGPSREGPRFAPAQNGLSGK